MHHELHTEIEIAAPIEVVWETLTDLDELPGLEPVHRLGRGPRRRGRAAHEPSAASGRQGA